MGGKKGRGKGKHDTQFNRINKISDEAVQYMKCNSRENVQKNVSNQLASNTIYDCISCEFCKEYFEFYYPGVKYGMGNNGHFNVLKGGKQNKEFYSSFGRICKENAQQCESDNNKVYNERILQQGNNERNVDEHLGWVAKIEVHNATEKDHFDYVFDSNNLKSLQEIRHQYNINNRDFLLGEGINEKILSKFSNNFENIDIKLSVPKFVFRNTNVLINRVYNICKSNQHLRDISYQRFASFVKDFIVICNKTFSNKYLEYCIQQDIIPHKFRKKIYIENKFRTRVIRNDCKNLSKDLMREVIQQTEREIKLLINKFGGYCLESCAKTDETSRWHIYNLFLRLRNITAYIMSTIHIQKNGALLQKTPHICVNSENVLDLAIKSLTGRVDRCGIQHSPSFYWMYREYTLEWILERLGPIASQEIEQNTLELQKKVWENFLSNVTKSKSLLPNKKQICNDWKNNWNRFLYGFRWGQNINRAGTNLVCDLNHIDQTINIPWYKPSVTLPCRSAPDSEIFLATLKLAINEEMSNLSQFELNSEDLIFNQTLLKNFLNDNQYRVVSSDKTNRCLLVKNSEYFEWGEKFLNESKDYLKLARDPNRIILDKVNGIVNSIKKLKHSFKKGDLDKLIKFHPAPAKLSFQIKDHKNPDEFGNYPLRPLANINGSALDSLDWILAKILNQGIKLVDYNVWNSQQILEIIPKINKIPIQDGYRRIAISLDVVGLYPSVPTFEASNLVFRFVKDRPEINTFGITYPIIREILNVIANNYNVEFNGNIYKQTKGVAMGARFSCAFSIIFMHILETNVVKQWFGGDILENTKLLYYGRYIDDTLLIFDEKIATNNIDPILEIFNTLHRNIKFTAEAKDARGDLPFLDMQLYFDENYNLCSKWYIKPQHSGNFIRGDEFIPENIKRNTIIERFRAVMIRSTEEQYAREGISRVIEILIKNNHSIFKIMGAIRQAHNKNSNSLVAYTSDTVDQSMYNFNWRDTKQNNFNLSTKEFEPVKSILKIPYISENLKSTINSVIEKFGRKDDIRVVYTSNQRVKFLKPSDNNRVQPEVRDGCQICVNMEGNEKYHCRTRIVVYKIQCRICQEFYIGKTNKTLKERVTQHLNAYKNKTTNSPLWSHESYFHGGAIINDWEGFFEKYKLIIIKQNSDYVLNNIDEAEHITKLKPTINRREEVPEWDIIENAILI